MSDLRDSGAIEQDADMVILNYRDAYYSKNESDDVFEMIVAKNRMGIEKPFTRNGKGNTAALWIGERLGNRRIVEPR